MGRLPRASIVDVPRPSTARAGSLLLDLGLMAIASFRGGVLVGTLFFFTTYRQGLRHPS
jgi:hypothetical protein